MDLQKVKSRGFNPYNNWFIYMFLLSNFFEIISKPSVSNLEVKLCGYGNKVTKFWAAYGNSCCGSLGIYDKSHLKCCDGVKIVQKYSVCGGHKYDQCTQICCDGKPHKKAEGATCCGKETYNIKTEICCKKRRVAKFRCKRVWSWRGYRYYLIFRNSEAVCHPYYRLYYRAKHDERCRGKFKKRTVDNIKSKNQTKKTT